MNDSIIQALNWRYAVQKFDTQKPLAKEHIETILEAARLAPSSFGTEPWQFIVVDNKDIRRKLHDEASPQAKVIDAPYFVVIATRAGERDRIADDRLERTMQATKKSKADLEGLHNTVGHFIGSLDGVTFDQWITNQTYIPLGIMIETAALLGVDSGPMTGFDHNKFDEILGLKQKNLASVSAIAFGYRGEDPAAERPKVRRDAKDVVTWIK